MNLPLPVNQNVYPVPAPYEYVTELPPQIGDALVIVRSEASTQLPGTWSTRAGAYGVWLHSPTLANGCNEWDQEPTSEADNQGNLCEGNVP